MVLAKCSFDHRLFGMAEVEDGVACPVARDTRRVAKSERRRIDGSGFGQQYRSLDRERQTSDLAWPGRRSYRRLRGDGQRRNRPTEPLGGNADEVSRQQDGIVGAGGQRGSVSSAVATLRYSAGDNRETSSAMTIQRNWAGRRSSKRI